ncbi:hypothetical protein WA026_005402 [Henosepilachna vigintioctopunctata]|uniref:Peroxidase n=1 Tax=Henosepilachna vigintioctopunctata TaxID=420089 RepID=A0AAW1U1N7_9CUCU
MFRFSPLVLFFVLMFLAFSHCWIFKYNGGLEKRTTRRKLTDKQINESITFAIEIYERRKTRESILGFANVRAVKGTPSYALYLANYPEPEALEMMQDSLAAAAASSNLFHERCYFSPNTQECENALNSYKLWNTPISKACERLDKRCTIEEISSKYRSYDGSCNNVDVSHKGRSFTAYERLMNQNYQAAERGTRRSVTKHPLSSASSISSQLNLDTTPDNKRTLAVLYWAQFVEHDLSHTAMTKMIHTDDLIECCDNEGRTNSPRYMHEFCLPIRISELNEYYATKDVTCLSYVRSMPAVGSDCSLGSTHQINQATHFLDASQIYGTSKLRRDSNMGHGGQMAVSLKGNSSQLPLSKHPESDCQPNTVPCYRSGDKRVNENPHIKALYTLWTREHNRLALELSRLNPRWDSEKVYEEARRIVIAEIQHITYSEWIPTVLGTEIAESYKSHGLPTISNAFATAAIRAFYSAGSNKRSLLQEEEQFEKDKSKAMKDILQELTTEKFRGKSLQHFGEMSNKKYGYDVLSLDIQRGRDHGLPTFNEFRKYCGLKELSTFDDLEEIIRPETVESLKEVYESVEDIDLIVGGISEIPDNRMFGPTITCILAKQFRQTMESDRYFYTNPDQPVPFSEDQLNEIQKVTLARIICDNAEDVNLPTPHVFEVYSDRNSSHVSCSTDVIPRLNLKYWDSNRYYYTKSP